MISLERRTWRTFDSSTSQRFFSRWPPKANRMAESSLSAKSRFAARANRSNSAVLSTRAGTPSSMAALIVQRPSPESETRPEKSVELGSSSKAWAVRSSSQEEMTLPRRQTSAMSAQVQVVLVVLGIAQRRRLGVDLLRAACRCWHAEDIEALGIGGHQAVFDAVVDHLDEMPGAVRAAVQIALLGGAAGSSRARRARRVPIPGASAAKIGSRCFTTSGSPPIIMQ